jgi:hypothetical protein
MDPSAFDTLVKAHAQRGTRRWLVRLVASLSLGGVLAVGEEAGSAAERPHERLARRTQQRNRKQRTQRQQNQNQNTNNGGGGNGGGGGGNGGGGNDNKNNNRDGNTLGSLPTACASVLMSAGCQIETFPNEGAWLCPDGANLEEAQLFECDLSHADLEGTNLRGALLSLAILSSAFLTGADLTGANLSEATLQGAFMDNVDVSGVTWDGTTCPDGTNSDDDGLTCCGHLIGTPRAGC